VAIRVPPADFVARVRALAGSDWDVRWNDALNRWEFISTSAGGARVSQFLGWDKNPLTGATIEPDPVTGLLPFRDLDAEGQASVLKALEETYIGNRVDGAGTWRRQIEQRMAHNQAVREKSWKERGQLFADLIKEVDLNRPWLKDHERGKHAAEIRDRRQRRQELP
jgi:hypothetical protein